MTEVLIAVMGATGSGKTTFVNQASGLSLQVGEGLSSCTSNVEEAGPFNLDGRSVTLIDTPGFDDTTLSDVEILSAIGEYLAATYKDGKRLSGILYMHRISDVRMGGISRRNFKMFRELCGERTLSNVIIITNMWGNVSRELGEEREAELASEDIFFKPCLEKGAKMVRNDPNHQETTHNILRHILNNHPLPLQIQEELVDEGKGIADTSAGVELEKELREEAEKHRRQLEEYQQAAQETMRSREEEHRVRMELEAEEQQNRMRELELQSIQLQIEFERHQREAERAAQEEQERLRREAEQAAIEFERRAEELRRQAQEESERARQEAERIQEEVRRAEEQARHIHPMEHFGRQVDDGMKWFVGEVGHTFGWW